jgi:DnaK suppressor protein
MTTAKLEKFRTILLARKEDLEGGIRRRGAIVIESSADPLDQIQNAGERDLSIGNLERESKSLAQSRAALARIDAGTFGICEECEEEISPQRLLAVPWTTACIRCQEDADRKQVEDGTRADDDVAEAA